MIATPAFAQPTAPRQDEKEVRPDNPPPTPDKQADAPVEPAPEDSLVTIHMESPVPVSLERRTPGSTTWENVCTTPCDVKTSSISEYRVVGSELNDSKPFMVDGTKDTVNLTVVPGRQSRANAGVFILIGGGVLTLVGIGVMVLGSDRSDVSYSDGQTHSAHLNAIFYGGALVLAGVTAGIFGGGWMASNRHTGVNGDVAKVIDEKAAPSTMDPNAPGAPSAPPPAGGSAEVKFSTWNTHKELQGLPSIVNVPIFSGKF